MYVIISGLGKIWSGVDEWRFQAALSWHLGHFTKLLPVHLRDKQNLSTKHTLIFQEFQKGNFTVLFKRQKRLFSSMAMEQCHEQNNAIVKGLGGAIGLVSSPYQPMAN